MIFTSLKRGALNPRDLRFMFTSFLHSIRTKIDPTMSTFEFAPASFPQFISEEEAITYDGFLPDITAYLTSNSCKTFETLSRVYGPSSIIQGLRWDVFFNHTMRTDPVCDVPAITDLEHYNIKIFENYPLPAAYPFATDNWATLI